MDSTEIYEKFWSDFESDLLRRGFSKGAISEITKVKESFACKKLANYIYDYCQLRISQLEDIEDLYRDLKFRMDSLEK